MIQESVVIVVTDFGLTKKISCGPPALPVGTGKLLKIFTWFSGINRRQPETRLPATNPPCFPPLQLQCLDPEIQFCSSHTLWLFFSLPPDWIITTSVGGFCCWVSIAHGCLAVLERRQAKTLQAGEKPPPQGFILQGVGLFYLRRGARSTGSLNPQAHKYSIWLQFLLWLFFSPPSATWVKHKCFKSLDKQSSPQVITVITVFTIIHGPECYHAESEEFGGRKLRFFCSVTSKICHGDQSWTVCCTSSFHKLMKELNV